MYKIAKTTRQKSLSQTAASRVDSRHFTSLRPPTRASLYSGTGSRLGREQARQIRNAVQNAYCMNLSKKEGWAQNQSHESGEGYKVKDLDKGVGLRCDGWQELLEGAFDSAIKPYFEKRHSCFWYETLYRDGPLNHTWSGINSLSTSAFPQTDDAEIELDPWRTGGRLIFGY